MASRKLLRANQPTAAEYDAPYCSTPVNGEAELFRGTGRIHAGYCHTIEDTQRHYQPTE